MLSMRFMAAYLNYTTLKKNSDTHNEDHQIHNEDHHIHNVNVFLSFGPCSFVRKCQRFGEAYYLHVQGA